MSIPRKPVPSYPPPLRTRSQKRTQETGSSQFLDGDISPGIDDGPYIRFAIDQLTRDEELLGRGRQGSVDSTEYPVNRLVGDEGLGYYGDRAPATKAPIPPETNPSRRDPAKERRPDPDEILLPVAPPHGTQWPDLGFLPHILRPPMLALLILACLLMIAGLLFSNIYSLRSHGFIDYDGTGTPRYFLFQFLPQLLGIILILWLFAVQAAIYRILPFMIMASRRPGDRVLQDVPMLPAHFLFPHLVHFRVGEPMVGTVLLIFWLANFTVPLLSCAYQTEFFIAWRWTSVQEVVWTLVALYAVLIIALVLCLVRFRAKGSALMWDPVSLADLIPLLQKSNILNTFERSEISGSMRTHIRPRLARLGYWTTSKGPEIFHGIGEENAPAWPSAEGTDMNEKHLQRKHSDSFDIERQRYSNAESFTRNIHSPYIRYRWAPWFLQDRAVITWLVILAALTIAFIVVSFVKNAVEHGFQQLLSSSTNSHGFSSSNFLYSFIPAFIGMFLLLAWQPIDIYFRAVQPFVNLSHPKGATAEHSLLLAYPSCYHGEVTVLALLNRDFRVAWISFVSLLSIAIPVLAGGVFTAQQFNADHQVRVVATMPAYYALCVFVAVYAASYLTVWPTRKRYLPHKIHTLADLLSFMYQSPLLTDPTFREPKTKADLVGRLMVLSASEDRRRNARYAFGIYVGRDGREHLGIDRLQRPGSREMLITTGMVR